MDTTEPAAEHMSESKEVETWRNGTPTESDTESDTRSCEEVEEYPEDLCPPAPVSQYWAEEQYNPPRINIDADIASITPSTRHKKRERQSGFLGIFGSTSPQRVAVVRPSTVQRRHTTIPTSNMSFVAQSTISSSSAKNHRPPLQSKKNNGGVLSTLFNATSSTSKRLPPQTVTCTTCLSDDILASKSAKLECGHRMCHSCLKRVFHLSIQDPQLMPPRCCTETSIPLRHVQRLFNDKFKSAWNKKYDEYTTKHRLYCPTKGCGEWIEPKHIKLDDNVGRRYGICPKCRKKVCKKCGLRWHGSRDCENDIDTKLVIDMGKEEGWQRCYRCRAMVQLSEGCNHMRCRCAAEFCYLCGERWKTCDCPLFNVPAESELGQRMPPPPPPWADFFPVDARRFRRRGDGNAVPMPPPPPPPPPPPFLHQPFPPPPPPPFLHPPFPPPPPPPMPLDPVNVPEAFNPPDLPRPHTRPGRQYQEQELTTIEQQQWEQEATDQALAELLQEQEFDTGLGIDDLYILDTESEYDAVTSRRQERAERRERRRQLAAMHEQGDTEWMTSLRPIGVGEGACEEGVKD